MSPRPRTTAPAQVILVVGGLQVGRRQAAPVVENSAALPAQHVVRLVAGLRDTRPTVRALALLPEPVELIEGGLAGQAPLNQETTYYCAGAPNPRTAMDIHTPTRLQSVVHAVEDLGHVHTLRRRAVVLDGLAEVFDAERKLAVVGLELVRLRKVDEAFDASLDEALQSFAGRLTARATGVLSGQHLAGYHPVVVTEWSWVG